MTPRRRAVLGLLAALALACTAARGVPPSLPASPSAPSAPTASPTPEPLALASPPATSTPAPAATPEVTPTAASAPLPTPTLTPSPTATPTHVPTPAPTATPTIELGPVRIVFLDCNSDPEVVEVRNSGDAPHSLWGWWLVSDGEGQRFDLGTRVGSLGGGAVLRVFSGSNAPEDNASAGTYRWASGSIFRNNDGSDFARLLAGPMEVQTVYCFVPTPTATRTPTPPASPTPAPSPTVTPVAGSPVRIASLSCNTDPEVVEIVNQGAAPQSLAGWWLVSDTETQRFDLGGRVGSLAAGAAIRVYSGSAAPQDNPAAGQYRWTGSFVFRNNDASDFARLVAGTTVLQTVHCG